MRSSTRRAARSSSSGPRSPAGPDRQPAWYLPLLAGIFLQQLGLIGLALILYALVVLFHLVTLPVELDASRRAMSAARQARRSPADPHDAGGGPERAAAAAMTYVAAALASLAQLAYFALAFLGNRN